MSSATQADCIHTVFCDFILVLPGIQLAVLFLAVRLHCSEYFLSLCCEECTVGVDSRQIVDQCLDTLFELKKFIALVVARGVVGGWNLRVKNSLGKSWVCAMFSQAMTSNIRFLEVMRYIRFDPKTERRRKLFHYKNFQNVFFPQQAQH